MLRRWIIEFDRRYLNSCLVKQVAMRHSQKLHHTFSRSFECNFTSFHDTDIQNEFAQLCDRYGSDKGTLKPNEKAKPFPWPAHTYADLYDLLFSHCKLSIESVLEVGIGSTNPAITSNMSLGGKPGASLRVLRDYFNTAQIYGADVDIETLFTEDRIKTFYVDQLDSKSIEVLHAKIGNIKHDIIIDDGLHTFEAGSTLFNGSIQNLKRNGIYIIEDVNISDMYSYRQFFENKNFRVSYHIMKRSSNFRQPNDNNLVLIRN